MEKKFSKKNFKKFPRKNEFQEMGGGKKPYVVCPVCGNVYYKKSWHADFPSNVLPEKRDVRFEVCPADRMAKDGTFEGQIRIENIPKKIQKELLNLVKNSDALARQKDPQDRVLRVRQKGGIVEVETSENQLAVRIAKKIVQTFKAHKARATYSKEPYDVARAQIIFVSMAKRQKPLI